MNPPCWLNPGVSTLHMLSCGDRLQLNSLDVWTKKLYRKYVTSMRGKVTSLTALHIVGLSSLSSTFYIYKKSQ